MHGWICIAMDKATKRFVKGKSKTAAWWTTKRFKRSSCESKKKWQLIHKRERNLDGNGRCRFEYQGLLRHYKKDIKETKVLWWRNFVRFVGNADPWGAVYKLCRSEKNEELVGIWDGDKKTETRRHTVEVLLGEFFPVDVPVNYELYEVVEKVNYDEVERGVRSMRRKKKSSGMDSVTPEMMALVWETVPDEWEVARLVILLKGMDKDRSLRRSYRPICLLSVMGKVFERVLVGRLARVLERRRSRAQFGFVKGLGIQDAWIRVKQVVEWSEKKYVLGIFVDFKGAFDNLSWNAVLNKLMEVGCKEIKIWASYFRDQKVCVVGGEMRWKGRCVEDVHKDLSVDRRFGT